MLLPIVGLMSIVLYGTTRASKPPSLQDGYGQTEVARSGYTEMEAAQPLQRIEPKAPPPPAPRLQSDVAAEEEAQRQAQAALRAETERAVQARADSIARATPASDESAPETADGEYVPAPLVLGN